MPSGYHKYPRIICYSLANFNSTVTDLYEAGYAFVARFNAALGYVIHVTGMREDNS